MSPAQHYRDMAEEARARAEEFTTIQCRAEMFSIAVLYEDVARCFDHNDELSAIAALRLIAKAGQ